MHGLLSCNLQEVRRQEAHRVERKKEKKNKGELAD